MIVDKRGDPIEVSVETKVTPYSFLISPLAGLSITGEESQRNFWFDPFARGAYTL